MEYVLSRMILKTIITFTTANILFFNIALGETMPKKTIAIDLDGVLNNYTKYTNEIPEIKDGAEDFIKTLSKDYELILFTIRSPKLATEWLIKYNLNHYFKDVTNVKPIAILYVDDRAINFSGDYNKALDKIKNFKTY